MAGGRYKSLFAGDSEGVGSGPIIINIAAAAILAPGKLSGVLGLGLRSTWGHPGLASADSVRSKYN